MAKILWFHPGCLLDMTSGAALDVHQQLHQLRSRGWQVAIGGASVFDSAAGYHNTLGRKTYNRDQAVLKVRDSRRQMHYLVNTRHWALERMTSPEINRIGSLFREFLDQHEPDVFYFYGGDVINLWMAMEARRRGILVAAYVANQNYASGTLWAQDVDLVMTNTQGHARWYHRQIGVDMVAIGLFVDPDRVRAARPRRRHMLFVNPGLNKGGLVVAQLACRMERDYPNITFEVVESRGQWQPLVDTVLSDRGEAPRALNNVRITPAQTDMRAVYGRARVLLAPTGGRVVVEAAINGIPSLVTQREELPATAGASGIRLTLPEYFYQPPYDKRLPDEGVTAVVGRLMQLYDDSGLYQQLSDNARRYAQKEHGLTASADRLESALLETLRDSRRADRQHNRCEIGSVPATPTPPSPSTTV